MCGIVGWIDWERDLSGEGAQIVRMADTMQRRGPDEKGSWLSKRAALGHRRLSVIDPAHGQQPMVYTDGTRTLSLVYNGELYNFRELREELIALRHVFRTRCDTEVLLHAYAEWGADCVRRFDGIFAFGIWDEAKQQLFLARDRMGVKPLFWTQRGSAVLFASEIKALLAHPLVPAEVDADGVLQLMVEPPPAFAPTPGYTAIRGVNELRPGAQATFERGQTTESRYWQLVSKPHPHDLAGTVAHVRELVAAAVKRQLVSDVPLACLLSGGVDSSGIAALASRELPAGAALQTWCIDFVDGEKDFVKALWRPSRDAPFAEEMAKHLGADHRTIRLDTSEMGVETLLEVMRARDMPVGSQLDMSLLQLFKAVKTGATVALSGEAGDELFGGYVWHWGMPIGQVNSSAHSNRAPGYPWISADLRFGTRSELDPHEYLLRRYREAVTEVPHLDGESDVAKKWREAVYLGLTRWLPYLLNRKDRLGMYASVEGRVPFCDQSLVEYMWNVPLEMQKGDGVEKTILRQAFGDLLPASILGRKKSAFPYYDNPFYARVINERVRELLSDGTSPAFAVLDRSYFEQLLATGVTNIDRYVCEKLIQVDAWMREYRVRLV